MGGPLLGRHGGFHVGTFSFLVFVDCFQRRASLFARTAVPPPILTHLEFEPATSTLPRVLVTNHVSRIRLTVTHTIKTQYVKHSFTKNKNLNVWEKTVYLNATAAAPLAFFSILFECTNSSLGSEELSITGVFWLLCSCVMGVALASASNKSRDFLSATAFDVMSTGSKFLTILVSGLIFDSMYTPQSLVGLLVALFGGCLYSPIGVWLLRCVGLRKWVGNDENPGLGLPTRDAGYPAGHAAFRNGGLEKAVTWAQGLGGTPTDSPRKGGVE